MKNCNTYALLEPRLLCRRAEACVFFAYVTQRTSHRTTEQFKQGYPLDPRSRIYSPPHVKGKRKRTEFGFYIARLAPNVLRFFVIRESGSGVSGVRTRITNPEFAVGLYGIKYTVCTVYIARLHAGPQKKLRRECICIQVSVFKKRIVLQTVFRFFVITQYTVFTHSHTTPLISNLSRYSGDFGTIQTRIRESTP